MIPLEAYLEVLWLIENDGLNVQYNSKEYVFLNPETDQPWVDPFDLDE